MLITKIFVFNNPISHHLYSATHNIGLTLQNNIGTNIRWTEYSLRPHSVIYQKLIAPQRYGFIWGALVLHPQKPQRALFCKNKRRLHILYCDQREYLLLSNEVPEIKHLGEMLSLVRQISSPFIKRNQHSKTWKTCVAMPLGWIIWPLLANKTCLKSQMLCNRLKFLEMLKTYYYFSNFMF